VKGVLADVRTSFAALGRSFRSPDIAKALAAYLAFTIAEWAALIAPVGSVLGDRHRRERVLVYSDR
jgi:hypothetical protein